MVAAVTDAAPRSVAEGLRLFLAGYPELEAGTRITTDLTGEKAGSLAVSPAGEELVREDVAGNRTISRKYWVYRNSLASDEKERRENQEFMERLTQWIREKDQAEELPQLPEFCRAEGIQPGESRIMESSGGKGRSYRLELTLIFTEKRRE